MTQLLLIRHGQASFGTADYDQLSALGTRQARLVGRRLAVEDAGFDALISGTMQRQTQTATLAAEAWTHAPALECNPAFDEYDHEALFAAYLPRVLTDSPVLAERREEIWRDRRLFQKAFEGITGHWIAGTVDDTERCESWASFCARVQGALTRLHDDYDRDSRIAVFTSGGPIAVAIATAVEASPRKTIEINWSIHNAAISALRSTRTGWRLTGFNDISALQAAGDRRLLTYR